MKKLITTMTVALILALSTPAFAQDAPAATATEAETAPDLAEPETAPDLAPAAEPEEVAAPEEEAAPEEGTAALEVSAPEASAFSKFMSNMIELLSAALMALMLALIAKATSYFSKKTKIEIPAQTEAMIAEWGKKAVHYGTEKAHQYNADNAEAMKGPEKLEVALGFGIGLAEEYGMTNLAKEKLTKYIESHLGEKRTSNNPA